MDPYAKRVAQLSMSPEDYALFMDMSGDGQHDVIANAKQRGGDNQAWRIAMDWVLKRPANR